MSYFVVFSVNCKLIPIVWLWFDFFFFYFCDASDAFIEWVTETFTDHSKNISITFFSFSFSFLQLMDCKYSLILCMALITNQLKLMSISSRHLQHQNLIPSILFPLSHFWIQLRILALCHSIWNWKIKYMTI